MIFFALGSGIQVLTMKDNSKAAQAQHEAVARLQARVEELARQVTQLEAGKRTLEKEKADLSKQLTEEREEREKMEEQVSMVVRAALENMSKHIFHL
jgi:predicted transcriptional regulator